MKKLIILRHGKSDWNDPEMDDYDRFLTNRGIENAQHDVALKAVRLAEHPKKKGLGSLGHAAPILESRG